MAHDPTVQIGDKPFYGRMGIFQRPRKMRMCHPLGNTRPLCCCKHNAAVKRQVAVHNVKLLLCKQRFVITIAAPVGKLIVRLVQNTHTGGSDLRLHGTRFFISQTIGAVKFFCIQSLLQPHGHNIRAAILQRVIYDQYFFLLVHCDGSKILQNQNAVQSRLIPVRPCSYTPADTVGRNPA